MPENCPTHKAHHMKYPFLLFLFMIIAGLSCKQHVIPPDNVLLGKDYFPLSVGHFIEYDVDSFKFNDFTKSIDTFYFELRDVIEEEFQDNEGRRSWLVNRFKRQDNSYPWKDNLTYFITETPAGIEVVEDNLRFIKMVFPVKDNTKWAGNVYLPANLLNELKWLTGWEYKYVNNSQPYDNGFLQFENTVTVNQADVMVNDSLDTDNYSARTFSKEVYAKNVGLVLKEQVNWEYQPSTTKYRAGFIIVYRAKDHN